MHPSTDVASQAIHQSDSTFARSELATNVIRNLSLCLLCCNAPVGTSTAQSTKRHRALLLDVVLWISRVLALPASLTCEHC
jgi:hypothetical protein